MIFILKKNHMLLDHWLFTEWAWHVYSSTSFLWISLPFGHTDLAGSEIQPFCWLVVLRCSSLWNANWAVTIPRPRWRRAVPLHPHGQSLLPTVAGEGSEGPFSEGKRLSRSIQQIWCSGGIPLSNLLAYTSRVKNDYFELDLNGMFTICILTGADIKKMETKLSMR